MYEVDFTGWTRDPEDIKKLKDYFWYRWRWHFNHFKKAIIYRRWNYFCWYEIKNLLFNRKKGF